jgi:hypothetical protein
VAASSEHSNKLRIPQQLRRTCMPLTNQIFGIFIMTLNVEVGLMQFLLLVATIPVSNPCPNSSQNDYGVPCFSSIPTVNFCGITL